MHRRGRLDFASGKLKTAVCCKREEFLVSEKGPWSDTYRQRVKLAYGPCSDL